MRVREATLNTCKKMFVTQCQTTFVPSTDWLYMLTEVDCTTRPFVRQLSLSTHCFRLFLWPYLYRKIKYTENMCIFFGRKIKKMRFSAPKKKTKFGRPLVRIPTVTILGRVIQYPMLVDWSVPMTLT